MTININEKKALYAFGCPNHEATIKRLRMLTALTPDPKTKKFFYNISVKLSEDGVERWYSCFYYNMRLELFSKKHPDLCRLDMNMGQGGVCYYIDKSRLSIRFQPPMSEERRRKASELAKQNGFNSQNG